MPGENEQRYLNQSGLSALWDKIRARDIALSGEISAISTSVSSSITDLTKQGVGGVTGVLGISGGGLGVTNYSDARGSAYLDVYSKSEVDSLVNGKVEVVQTLPATGESDKIYYVGPTGSGSDKYDEYIWDATNSQFINVGEHSIDLSDYINTVTVTGTGNAVTTTAKSGNTLTLGKDETFVLSSDFNSTIAGMTTSYDADAHKVITAISQASGTITAIGQKQLGTSDIYGLDTLTGNIESDIQYVSGGVDFVSGAVTALDNHLTAAETGVIDTLNSRINNVTADVSTISSTLNTLNSRVNTLSGEVTAAFDNLNYTSSFNGWQTIVGITSTSGKLAFSAADIPAITQQDIEDLDDGWEPASNNEGE